MDWANDQLGKLVHAAEKRLFAYGFTCPTCGERVRLRAGQERRPHFAHYSHSTKLDCENYHPTSYEVLARATRSWNAKSEYFDKVSLRGGVFLDRAEGGRFSLVLKLPRLKSDVEVCGELEIQSGLGVRFYKAIQLKQIQYLPVSPASPLVKITATDELRDAAAAIREDISLFQPSGNIFRTSDDCGGLLAPGQPLEWGESYRVVTPVALPNSTKEFKCQVVAQFGSRGWLIYDVELPQFTYEAATSVAHAVSQLFGREIKLPTARVFVVDPLPHHIDPDGTYVYPVPPERLLLRRTAASKVSVDGSAQTKEVIVHEFGEWIEIRDMYTGEFSIRLDGHVQISVRIDECDIYRPDGIRVLVDNAWWDIFDLRLRKVLLDQSLEVIVECPTARVSNLLSLNVDDWNQRGNSFTLKKPVFHPPVDAKNFGAITWAEELDAALSIDQSSDAPTAARRAWIEGIVARQINYDALSKLRNAWKADNPIPFCVTPLNTLAWLAPYLRSTSKRGESKR